MITVLIVGALITRIGRRWATGFDGLAFGMDDCYLFLLSNSRPSSPTAEKVLSSEQKIPFVALLKEMLRVPGFLAFFASPR